jgi:hypothetical protein
MPNAASADAVGLAGRAPVDVLNDEDAKAQVVGEMRQAHEQSGSEEDFVPNAQVVIDKIAELRVQEKAAWTVYVALVMRMQGDIEKEKARLAGQERQNTPDAQEVEGNKKKGDAKERRLRCPSLLPKAVGGGIKRFEPGFTNKKKGIKRRGRSYQDRVEERRERRRRKEQRRRRNRDVSSDSDSDGSSSHESDSDGGRSRRSGSHLTFEKQMLKICPSEKSAVKVLAYIQLSIRV